MSEHDDENPEDERHRRRTQLIGLLVVLALVAGGLWLSSVLGAASRIQDCVMSGRTNCVRFN